MSFDRLALYTVVYPGVERYLAAWYESVCCQSDQKFDLWISIDSLRIDDVTRILGVKPSANWLIASPHQSPATIRQEGLQQIARDYSIIVLVDSDDVLYPSRIQFARKDLENHDVTACALRFIDDAGKDLNLTFASSLESTLDDLLLRTNVFGLSNSAYRSETLLRCLPIPDDCILIDWLLATRAWLNGASMHFDASTHMAYRQHGRNTTRVIPPFRDSEVRRAADLVLGHYRIVLESIKGHPASLRTQALREAFARAQVFYRTVTSSAEHLTRYITALNQLPPQYLWWWTVAHPALEDIWNPYPFANAE
jgi:hypothetical protein